MSNINKFYVIYLDDGKEAGFTTTGYFEEDSLLWRAGSNWRRAEFENDEKGEKLK